MTRRLALAALVLASGCAEHGEATERDSACSTDDWNRRSTCTRRATVLSEGVTRDRVGARFIGQAESVRLQATVSVRSGAVRVWLEERGGERREVVVRPGVPAALAGRPRTLGSGKDPYFALFYQPLEGSPPRAEGLVVELAYDLQD